MKFSIRGILFCVALLTVFGASAHDHWRNRHVGSVAFDYSSPQDRQESFIGASVKGEYKKYLVKGLFVAPGVGLYYENCEPLGLVWDIYPGMCDYKPKDDSFYSYRLGAKISAMIGYTLPVYETTCWDFYTGPSFRHHLVARDNFHGQINNNTGDDQFCRWTALRWDFGIGFNIGRISLRAEYGLGLTDYDPGKWSETVADRMTLRVGYNF